MFTSFKKNRMFAEVYWQGMVRAVIPSCWDENKLGK
jgi:hypothetical protein